MLFVAVSIPGVISTEEPADTRRVGLWCTFARGTALKAAVRGGGYTRSFAFSFLPGSWRRSGQLCGGAGKKER